MKFTKFTLIIIPAFCIFMIELTSAQSKLSEAEQKEFISKVAQSEENSLYIEYDEEFVAHSERVNAEQLNDILLDDTDSIDEEYQLNESDRSKLMSCAQASNICSLFSIALYDTNEDTKAFRVWVLLNLNIKQDNIKHQKVSQTLYIL